MKNTIKWLTLLLISISGISEAQNSRHLQKSVSKSPVVSSNTQSLSAKTPVKSTSSTTEHIIAKYIQTRQPKKGSAYARKISKYIVLAAKEFHVDPYMVAATADAESTFTMVSRPQIGIMQFTKATGKTYTKLGMNIRDTQGNIRAGACKLSYHYYEYSRGKSRGLPSRGDKSTRSTRNHTRWQAGQGRMTTSNLKFMWGRYNGCGPNGGYVKKLMSRYNTVRKFAAKHS